MKPVPSPLTLGVEIEVNVPGRSCASAELQKALTDGKIVNGTYGGSSVPSPWFHGDRVWEANLPEKFRMPKGWTWNFDAGVEHKFNGPASTLDDAFDRLDRLGQYFKDWGVHAFSGAGTHVHIGVPAALEAIVGHDQRPGNAALNLAWGYLATRERGIFALLPSHRRIGCGGGAPSFPATSTGRSEFYLNPGPCDAPELCNSETPLLRIHNGTINSHYSHGHGWMPIYRKSIPTFEVRQFGGTANTDAVKGYMMLLLNMWMRAKSKIEKYGYKELIKPADKSAPDFLVRPFEYDIKSLAKEVEEAEYFSDELRTWMDATLKNDGQPTAFHCNLNDYRPLEDKSLRVLSSPNGYIDYQDSYATAAGSAVAVAANA